MTFTTRDAAPLASPSMLRPRLLELLNQQPMPPIILMVAPAGYGKTTLATQWAQTREEATTWLTLTGEHNSPRGLLRDLLEALQGPHTVEDVEPTTDEVLVAMTALAENRPGTVLVLDDCHLIEDRDTLQILSVVVSNLPKGMHLLLMSRTVPPIPLARRRLNGEVRDVSMEDLSFTVGEVTELIASRISDDQRLHTESAAMLVSRTEGWIVGIRLALASLEARQTTSDASIIDSWYTRQALDEFVLEEVLGSLPKEVQEFLFQTAFLPWLDPSLCNFALEIDHAAALLREATMRVTFVRPTHGVSSTLSYHALFAESVMRIDARHSSAQERQRRYRRAAEWFDRHGHREEALDQALRSDDQRTALDYITRICREHFKGSQPSSMLYWLKRLPMSVLLSDPEIAFWYVWALQNTGQLTEARHSFAVIDPVWQASNDPVQIGFSLASRRFFASLDGNVDLALELGYESLEHFPEERAAERLQTWSGIMQNEFLKGNDDLATAAYIEAKRSRDRLPQDQAWWTLVIQLDRANQRALRGELTAAMELYRHGLRTLSSRYRSNAGRILFRMAAINLEWNNLDEAARQATEIIQDVETYPYHVWHPEALMVCARISMARDEWESAEEILHRVRAMYNTHGGQHNLTRLEATEAELWLSTGREHLVDEWIFRARTESFSSVRIFGDNDPRIVLIRSLLTRKETATASALLGSMIQGAIASKRWAELVPMAMWQVAASLDQGDDAGAMEALQLALHHGRPGGFVRSYLTPGYDLRPFLHSVRPQLGEADLSALSFLQLDVMPPAPSPGSPSGEAPMLTPREHEVLQLVAVGLANQEIGARLFISERTVKKHLSNIFRKLGAPNRIIALARAIELGLLGL